MAIKMATRNINVDNMGQPESKHCANETISSLGSNAGRCLYLSIYSPFQLYAAALSQSVSSKADVIRFYQNILFLKGKAGYWYHHIFISINVCSLAVNITLLKL
jgi:hypothetical protein